jgi:hypothetical protein
MGSGAYYGLRPTALATADGGPEQVYEHRMIFRDALNPDAAWRTLNMFVNAFWDVVWSAILGIDGSKEMRTCAIIWSKTHET